MCRKQTDNLEEIITYGHDNIDPDEKVAVNLKDLMYVYATITEYLRFFHQPGHYPTIEDVHNFLGTVNQPKGFKILHTSVYKKMRDMFPEHIGEMADDGAFDHPQPPFYFNSG